MHGPRVVYTHGSEGLPGYQFRALLPSIPKDLRRRRATRKDTLDDRCAHGKLPSSTVVDGRKSLVANEFS